MDLKKLFTDLGIPLGLIAALTAVLVYFGIDIEKALAIGGSLLGTQFAIGVLIDVLKYVGALPDGYSGVASSIFNLIVFGLIVIALKFYPTFDFASADAQIEQIARFVLLVFGYMIQIANTKRIRSAVVYGFGLKKTKALAI